MYIRTELLEHEWSEQLMTDEVAETIPEITKGLGKSPEDVVYAHLAIPDFNFDWYVLGRDRESGRLYAYVRSPRKTADGSSIYIDFHPDDVWLGDIEANNKVLKQNGFGMESGEDARIVVRQTDWEPIELGEISAYRNYVMDEGKLAEYDRHKRERASVEPSTAIQGNMEPKDDSENEDKAEEEDDAESAEIEATVYECRSDRNLDAKDEGQNNIAERPSPTNLAEQAKLIVRGQPRRAAMAAPMRW